MAWEESAVPLQPAVEYCHSCTPPVVVHTALLYSPIEICEQTPEYIWFIEEKEEELQGKEEKYVFHTPEAGVGSPAVHAVRFMKPPLLGSQVGVD